jgi:hypothetical protein
MSTWSHIGHHRNTARSPGDIAYRRAWWALLGYIPSFVAAFVVGEGLYDLLHAGPGDADWWVFVLAATPALIVFAIPGALAWHFGQRAAHGGRPEGRTLAIIGVAVGVGFAVMNLLSGLVGLLAG